MPSCACASVQASSWASSLCFTTADAWLKRWWSWVPKSNVNLQKYTGRVNKKHLRKTRMFWISLCFKPRDYPTVDLDRAEAIISAGPANHGCARVHTPLSVFVAAGLDSCPAEAVHPSPMGHASAVYRALVGGPCTYPSWKVRAPMLRFTGQHIPWSRGSACGRHHLFTRHHHPEHAHY